MGGNGDIEEARNPSGTAQTYGKAIGGRLPTQPESEWAARGGECPNGRGGDIGVRCAWESADHE